MPGGGSGVGSIAQGVHVLRGGYRTQTTTVQEPEGPEGDEGAAQPSAAWCSAHCGCSVQSPVQENIQQTFGQPLVPDASVAAPIDATAAVNIDVSGAGTVDTIAGLLTGPADATSTGGPLRDHGVPALSSVQVFAILVGGPVDGHTQEEEEGFFTWLLGSQYLKESLQQYGFDGPGQFLGSMNLGMNADRKAVWTEEELIERLVTLVNNGTVPPPNENLVYFLLMPFGSTVNQMADDGSIATSTCDKDWSGDVEGALGWHSDLSTSDGQHLLYAVIGAPCRASQSFSNTLPDQWHWQQDVVSHELAEAITDPVDGGWFGSNGYESEIGDLCAGLDVGYPAPGGGTYTVQAQYSNANHAHHLPACAF
jgi:hypothetical protein